MLLWANAALGGRGLPGVANVVARAVRVRSHDHAARCRHRDRGLHPLVQVRVPCPAAVAAARGVGRTTSTIWPVGAGCSNGSRTSGLVIAIGDFNQSLVSTSPAPAKLRHALRAALPPGMRIVTECLAFDGRHGIDHSALSADLAATSVDTLSNLHPGLGLSYRLRHCRTRIRPALVIATFVLVVVMATDCPVRLANYEAAVDAAEARMVAA